MSACFNKGATAIRTGFVALDDPEIRVGQTGSGGLLDRQAVRDGTR